MFTVAAIFMLSWIPVIGTLIGIFLDACVSLANGITQNVEMLPYSLTNNIYLSPLQVFIIIVALIFLAFYIEFRNRKNIIVILACFTAFCGRTIEEMEESICNDVTIVYPRLHSGIYQ
jgi:hypothetical protein